MDFALTNEINVIDLLGVVGWAIGLVYGANWLRRRYAHRLESDPMRIFQSNMTDLETIVRMMENTEARHLVRDDDGSEDAQASRTVARVMADYRIQDMIYRGWLISCRDANRRNAEPYIHIRPVPVLYVVDPR